MGMKVKYQAHNLKVILWKHQETGVYHYAKDHVETTIM